MYGGGGWGSDDIEDFLEFEGWIKFNWTKRKGKESQAERTAKSETQRLEKAWRGGPGIRQSLCLCRPRLSPQS